MEDLKQRLPADVTIVGNFVFSRKDIAGGAVPDINTVPVGTSLLLAVEPARGNKEDTLAPGVRIGTDFWEMGEAVKALNDAGYHPMLLINNSSLRDIGLLGDSDDAYAFTHKVGLVSASLAGARHDIVTPSFGTLRVIRAHAHDTNKAPTCSIYLQNAPEPLMKATTSPSKRRHPSFTGDPTSPLFRIDAVIVNLPKRSALLRPLYRPDDINTTLAALHHAQKTFGIKKRAVLVDIREFGVEKPPMPPRNKTPDTLES